MSTTTIRLEDDLKARIAAAAERSGKSTHAFIMDAITLTVEQLESDEKFHRIADERWANILATQKTVPWNDAKSYIAARLEGKPLRRPNSRKLGR